jgi:hypothetical protein
MKLTHRPRHIFSAVAAVLSLLVVFAPAASVSAQGGATNPAALLEASARATQDVRGMRFTATLEMRSTGSGASFNMTMPFEGEFQRPDSFHMTGSIPFGGAADSSFEVISVGGRVWYRAGDEAWESSPTAARTTVPTQSFSPSVYGDLSSYLNDLRVTDNGATYTVTGTLDVSRLADAPASKELFGGGFGGLSPSDMDFAIGLRLTIDKQTMYMTGAEMTFSPPAGAAAPTSSAGRSMGGGSFTMRMTFSDFDDPSINIRPPSGVAMEP